MKAEIAIVFTSIPCYKKIVGDFKKIQIVKYAITCTCLVTDEDSLSEMSNMTHGPSLSIFMSLSFIF